MYELQILMGFNCNFKCTHCLNDSAPGKKEQDLSDIEIQNLIASISNNINIKIISFSGGEPLVYINKIKIIIDSVRKIRPDIKLSITTNGSLLKKNYSILKELKINYCMLSYDEEHSFYLDPSDFIDVLETSKSLFDRIELNVTYTEQPSLVHIKPYLLKNSIKVNFNKKIDSGRNINSISTTEQNFTLNSFQCPNITENNYKITYVPNKGYTICCGPLVFDRTIDDNIAYFKSLNNLSENILFKFLNKTRATQLATKKDIACHICKSIFKKMSPKEIEMFSQNTSWNNILLNWDTAKLDSYNEIFNPKLIKKVNANQFKNYLDGRELKSNSELKEFSGNQLTESEIEIFSNFTIESFYNVHTKYYNVADIRRFKNDQKVFFNLPYKYIYHMLDRKIVGYLVICEIEKHPFFKQKTWHIGYWGISSFLEKNEKDLIKLAWAKLLQELNKENPIGANIDYFNKPADIMSEKFNFKTLGLRLDPRQ